VKNYDISKKAQELSMERYGIRDPKSALVSQQSEMIL
jgi:hypothetical protein